MASTFRDRFYTRRVAHAITSPSAIVSTGAGAALGVLIFANPIGAVVLGAVALAGRVALAIPRSPKGNRIALGELGEPWRSLVRDALVSKKGFDQAVDQALPGPLKDRLALIGVQINNGVNEAWQTARAGNTLDSAYKRLNLYAMERELSQLPPTDTSTTVANTRAALLAQQRTARRMADMLTETRDELRLLNAQLGEAVTRCIELSAGAYKPDALDSLEGDVSQVLDSMEALRQAVDATDLDQPFGAMPDAPAGSGEPGETPGEGRTATSDGGV
jgi:hypothetical protein